MELPCALTEAAEVAARVLGSPIEPAALEWTSDDAAPAAAGGHRQRSRRSRRPGAWRCSAAGARVAEGDPWARHAALTRGDPDAAVLRIGVRPSRLPSLLASLPAAAATAGLGTGVATVTVPAGAVADVHTLVNAAGGDLGAARPPGRARTCPRGARRRRRSAVLRAVKRAFDPDDRLGPGRFDPWM